MFWFFTPPFWMDNIETGHCDRGDGFVDTGWDYKSNVRTQYDTGGAGKMSVATFGVADHEMDTLYYGDPRRFNKMKHGGGDGGGWPNNE